MIYLCLMLQVMETEKMIYLVLEYASGGEIFGNIFCLLLLTVKGGNFISLLCVLYK